MQNGFVSKGGSYDKLGMNIGNYQRVVPTIKQLIDFCRSSRIPVFYTEAVREPSGIDLLLNIRNILPTTREERLEKIPICVRGTCDAQTIDEIKSTEKDHVIIKRRDSAFQDTELRVWLQSIGINTLIFCGIDTSICVETSLIDGFNPSQIKNILPIDLEIVFVVIGIIGFGIFTYGLATRVDKPLDFYPI